MPEGVIINAKKISIGTKQTLKAVEKDQAKKVFIAADAEPHVIKPISQLCKAKAIPVEVVQSMTALGKACGIEVGCAAAAILEE